MATMNKAHTSFISEGYLANLGLFGYSHLEPLILASLVSSEPLLLIGKAGTGKTQLLNRLSDKLKLEHRHYNASLLSFDDLLGFPFPDSNQESIRYLTTPSSIWGAQSLFVDEINRCKPDVQNKFFSLIHECKIQGVPLTELKFRWAAMNPVATGLSPDDLYEGCEALDPALADRFSFIVEVPDWQDLTEVDQRHILNSISGLVGIQPDLAFFLQQATIRFQQLQLCQQSTEYFLRVSALLFQEGLRLSPRRLQMMARNFLSIQAVFLELANQNWVIDVPEIQDYLWLTLKYSLPQRAYRTDFTEQSLEAFHATAWRLASITDASEKWAIEFFMLEKPQDRVERILDASIGKDVKSLGLVRWLGHGSDELAKAVFCFSLFPLLQLHDMITEDAFQQVLKIALPILNVDGNLEWKDAGGDRNGAHPAWASCLRVLKKLETHNPERGKRAKQMFLYVLVHLKLAFDPEQLELDMEECFLFASSALAAAEPWK